MGGASLQAHLPPLVRIAAACEKVLHEKDEAISLVRIVDRFIVSGADADPAIMPDFTVPLTLVLSTVAGHARGNRELAVNIRKPDGTISEGPTLRVEYDEDVAARNWVVVLHLRVVEQGLFWVEWTCDRELLTRMPLQIQYLRKSSTGEMTHQ